MMQSHLAEFDLCKGELLTPVVVALADTYCELPWVDEDVDDVVAAKLSFRAKSPRYHQSRRPRSLGPLIASDVGAAER